jgi:predicted membrane-bound spermidine synthase
MMRGVVVAVTVFVCGWVLMGLEIVGGRMLAPYFGSGVWVWGSIISVFLAALSVGYFVGGLCSNRYPSAVALAAVIALAGITLIPVSMRYAQINEWIAAIDLHERWGSLLAAACQFLAPSVLLGMVSPYAVRLVTRRVEEVGSRAGSLYAISTVGSCLGCLVTSFDLILRFGIRHILAYSSATLILTAIALLILWSLTSPRPEGNAS